MKGNCSRGGGNGLICAGTVVFLVGLAIIVFKELNIPRYWSTAAIGLLLIIAGLVARFLKRTCGRRETLDQGK